MLFNYLKEVIYYKMKPSEIIPSLLEYYKTVPIYSRTSVAFSSKFGKNEGIFPSDHSPIAFLLAKETGRPFFTYSKNPRIIIDRIASPETIAVLSSSLKLSVLLNKLLKKYYNIWPTINAPVGGVSRLFFRISIASSLLRNSNNIANLITLLGSIFKHKIQMDRKDFLRCSFCGRKAAFVDVPICFTCLSRIRKINLIKYGETLDPNYLLNSNRNQLRRRLFDTARILLGLRRMPRRKRRYSKCIICGSELGPSSYYNGNICQHCESKYDFEFFQVEYINNRVNWKDFENDPKVRKRYEYFYFRSL